MHNLTETEIVGGAGVQGRPVCPNPDVCAWTVALVRSVGVNVAAERLGLPASAVVLLTTGGLVPAHVEAAAAGWFRRRSAEEV